MPADVLFLAALCATLWLLGGHITYTALTAIGTHVGYLATMLVWPFAVIYSVIR
jgi:hypothetical protein